MYEKLKLWHLEVSERAGVIWDNLSKFTSLPGKTFLDFGCGEGGMAIYFAKKGMTASGADITQAQLERSRLRAREEQVGLAAFLINEQGRIPEAPDEQFDIVLCHTVIEHCRYPEVTISELKRLLKKGGLIYLTTCNRLGLGWIFKDAHYHLPLVSFLPKFLSDPLVRKFRKMENDVTHLFTPIGLNRIFKKHGLKVVYSYPDEVREKIQKPGKIVSPFKSGIFTILNKLRITRLLPLLMPVIHLFTDSLIYILTKEQ